MYTTKNKQQNAIFIKFSSQRVCHRLHTVRGQGLGQFAAFALTEIERIPMSFLHGPFQTCPRDSSQPVHARNPREIYLPKTYLANGVGIISKRKDG